MHNLIVILYGVDPYDHENGEMRTDTVYGSWHFPDGSPTTGAQEHYKHYTTRVQNGTYAWARIYEIEPMSGNLIKRLEVTGPEKKRIEINVKAKATKRASKKPAMDWLVNPSPIQAPSFTVIDGPSQDIFNEWASSQPQEEQTF